MHFEILVEDQSGKKVLDCLIPKIIGHENTFKVIPYKGIGHIPGKMNSPKDASKRILLDNLPRLLQGYGQTWKNYPAAVFVVCDLDDKCLSEFRKQLVGLLNSCHIQPVTRFCIAIEEGEAWFLGDMSAVRKAYPTAKEAILQTYRNDAICGTWEVLADAVYKGGSQQLSKQGWKTVGLEKSRWAENITPYMDVDNNNSPSFNYFVRKLRELATKDC